jgi:hypothetical protein
MIYTCKQIDKHYVHRLVDLCNDAQLEEGNREGHSSISSKKYLENI